MKILVVDDERAVRESLRRALELEGTRSISPRTARRRSSVSAWPTPMRTRTP
jgi:DNA-binding response OmpR family regulator